MASLSQRAAALADRLRSTARQLIRRRIDTGVTDRWMEARIIMFNNRSAGFARELAGSVDIDAWLASLEQELRRLHVSAVAISAGKLDNLDSRTSAVGLKAAEEQIAYARAWADQMRNGSFDPEDEKAVIYRSRLYGGAAWDTYYRGQAASLGLPDMPFYPASRTKCRTNCRCRWDYRRSGSGWDCYYLLGAAEHCPNCVARHEAANPLQVRGGRIVNPEQYQDARFYAA